MRAFAFLLALVACLAVPSSASAQIGMIDGRITSKFGGQIDTSAKADTYVLTYQSSTGKWIAAAGSTFSPTITSATTGDLLRYNGSAWVNATTSVAIDTLGSTRGQILYRNATVWTVLSPSTAGYPLTSGGAGADPAYASPSAVLDVIGTTRGSVLYRGASGWAILAPGTSTHVLTSNGAGADPSYQAAAGGSLSGITNSVAGQLVISTGAGAITNLRGATDQNLAIVGGVSATVGRAVSVTGGASGANTFDGGTVTLVGGVGLTSGDGGAIELQGGQAGATGDGGYLDFIAAAGGATSGSGGNIGMYAGAASGSSNAGSIFGTAGQSETGTAGDVTFTAGQGGSTSGDGGIFTGQGGAGAAGDGAGGESRLTGGDGNGTGSGGRVVHTAGSGGATGDGAGVDSYAGNGGVTSGSGGSVRFFGGSALTDGSAGGINMEGGSAAGTDRNGGSIVLNCGPATGTGTVSITHQTSFRKATGTTAQTLYDRYTITSQTFTCSTTTLTANTICLMSNAVSNSGVGATVQYTIEVGDGADHWSTIHGTAVVSASNRAGTVTATCTGAGVTNQSISDQTTWTALSCTTTATVSGTDVQIKVTPAWTTGTPTVVRCTYQVQANGQATLTPQ